MPQSRLMLYGVRGQSMSPTLRAGDALLARGMAWARRPPRRGDVVVARMKLQAQRYAPLVERRVAVPRVVWKGGRDVMKRVVGLPGERVALRDGTLFIDGAPLREKYLRGKPPHLGLDAMEWDLGTDEYFIMGDNRAHSDDSRVHGPVSAAAIEAKVVCRVWPPLRWGVL